jgi:hypothetical protein
MKYSHAAARSQVSGHTQRISREYKSLESNPEPGVSTVTVCFTDSVSSP